MVAKQVKTNLSANLAKLRKAHGETLRELAARTGLSYQHISCIELGVGGSPSMSTVILLSRAYGLSTEELLFSADFQVDRVIRILNNSV